MSESTLLGHFFDSFIIFASLKFRQGSGERKRGPARTSRPTVHSQHPGPIPAAKHMHLLTKPPLSVPSAAGQPTHLSSQLSSPQPGLCSPNTDSTLEMGAASEDAWSLFELLQERQGPGKTRGAESYPRGPSDLLDVTQTLHREVLRASSLPCPGPSLVCLGFWGALCWHHSPGN